MHDNNIIFKELGNIKTVQKYDILVPISGGKDGIYLLWYFKKNTNYRILAFNYDNWFISDQTNKNIIRSLKKIGCDFISFKPQWNLSRDIYKKLLTRMGEICISCEMILNFSVFQYAVINKIPYVAWGLTIEQMKKKNISGFKVKTDDYYYAKLENYYNILIENLFEDDFYLCDIIKREYIKALFNSEAFYPYFIYPFYLLPYDPNKIEQIITDENLWVRPCDTGGISSNCVINNLHVYLKKQVYGSEYYKNILREKLEKNQISPIIYENACKDSDDQEEYYKIINDLGIDLSLDEIIEKIKNYPKSALLRSEKYIGI